MNTFLENFNDYETLWQRVQTIPGHVTQNEGFLLYLLGGQCSLFGNIVEVGSFHGRSSVLLGKGTLDTKQRKGNLVCIDNFVKQESRSCSNSCNPKESLMDNIKQFGLWDIFELYEEDGAVALRSIKPETCGLVFIDSDHTENQISKEFPAALNTINKQGLILIHDYRNPAVDMSYTEWIRENVQSKYNTIFVQDSTPTYVGNGLLIVKPNEQ